MTRTPPDRLLRALAGRLHDEDVSIRTKMLEAAAKLDEEEEAAAHIERFVNGLRGAA